MKRRFTLLLWILIVGTVAPLAETLFVMNADKAREEASFGTKSLIRRAHEQMAEMRQARLDSLREQMLDEVTSYIKKVAPTSYEALPACMVEQCLENELDLCFMLSQTQLETCFGTQGMGRATSRYSPLHELRELHCRLCRTPEIELPGKWPHRARLDEELCEWWRFPLRIQPHLRGGAVCNLQKGSQEHQHPRPSAAVCCTLVGKHILL